MGLLDRLKAHTLKIHGVITPPVVVNGKKTGIDLVDLKSGERKQLATLRGIGSAQTATQKWVFNDGVIQWGNLILSQAVPCQLLVIDELGPLELERGMGLLAGLAAINSLNYSVALVVIRPLLVPTALNLMPEAKVEFFSRESGSGIMAKLADEILTACQAN